MMKMENIALKMIQSREEDLTPMVELVKYFRVKCKSKKTCREAFHELEEQIVSNLNFRSALKEKLTFLILNHNFYHFFVLYTFLEGGGFVNGVWSRIVYKILPVVYRANDIKHCIQKLITPKKDLQWIAMIPKSSLIRIVELLDLDCSMSRVEGDLDRAISALSVKVCAFGMDGNVTEQYERLNLDTGFFYDLQTTYSKSANYLKVLELLDQIEATVHELRYRKNEIGTTIYLTYSSKKVLLNIERLKRLWELKADFSNQTKWIELVIESISTTQRKYSLTNYFVKNFELIALEIVEHTARKGESYIAENKAEYFKFFRASLLGGFIIAFFATFKIFLDGLNISGLSQALFFSLNYAACFVLVKNLGGIIATKQPAMTSSMMIKSIDSNNDLLIDSIPEVIELTKKVMSSQFISFAGNLAMAFPMAILLNWLLVSVFGIDFISEYKAGKIITDIRPIYGGAIWYAAIAGVFLSLSGFIAGYFDNKVIAIDLRRRILKHKTLNNWFSTNTLNKIANYFNDKLGAVSGNVSLGFLLGMSGYIGTLVGLPIDIRHIAFSSSNLGFVFQSLNMDWNIIALGFFGIFMIGFTNFIVSFGLTYFLVLKSRQITFQISGELVKALFKAFLKAPFSFFYTR